MKKIAAGVAMAAACVCGAAQKETILVAADPFAVGLRTAVVQHLEKRGFAVKDLGATDANKEKPYFESAVDVCKALQRGEAKRAFDTKFTEGLEGLAPFLHEAAKKVEAIDGR